MTLIRRVTFKCDTDAVLGHRAATVTEDGNERLAIFALTGASSDGGRLTQVTYTRVDTLA